MTSNPPPKDRFRTALLSVVKHRYIPDAVFANPRFELVVVADDDDQPDWVHARNQEYADEHGIPYVRDVARAIAQFQPGVAIVSSQAERHCDISVRAVEAGLHLIVDKPLSTSLDECDRLVAAAGRKGVKSLVWNRNYLPALVHAHELIECGTVGEITAIHCDFYFSKDAGPPVTSASPGDPPINWLERQIEAHADGSDGGVGDAPMGELQIEGIYPLAYIRWLTGASFQSAFARTATHFHQANVDNGVDDLATVTLELERGIVATLCIGRIGAASHPDIGEIKLHILGSRGALVISEARPEVGVYYRDQPPSEFKHERVSNDNDVLLIEEFVRAIDSGGPTVLDVTGARHLAAVVDAALRSAESGNPVPVEDPDPVNA